MSGPFASHPGRWNAANRHLAFALGAALSRLEGPVLIKDFVTPRFEIAADSIRSKTSGRYDDRIEGLREKLRLRDDVELAVQILAMGDDAGRGYAERKPDGFG